METVNYFSNQITVVRFQEFIEIIAGNARRENKASNKGITKHAHTHILSKLEGNISESCANSAPGEILGNAVPKGSEGFVTK